MVEIIIVIPEGIVEFNRNLDEEENNNTVCNGLVRVYEQAERDREEAEAERESCLTF